MDQRLADYERTFRRAGLPLFIEDYRAREDIFNRAVPFFAIVFVAELVGAVDLHASFLVNVGLVAAGVAILLGGLGVLNRLRGRRFWSVPQSLGTPELATFVILPALLPLLAGQTTSAWVTALVNLALVGLVYLVVGYGLPSILRLSAERLLGELARSLMLLTRALPLLLIFAVVLFINTEMWQVISTMPDAFVVVVGVLLVLLGVAFLVARLPREVATLERDSRLETPLRRRQRVNVGLVMLFSQGLQILVVSLAVGAFFVLFGLFTITPEVREAWIQGSGSVLVSFELFGEPIDVTEELLRVSGGIAAVSGLYFAIAVLTDSTYREEFLDELTREMRDVFVARREYLVLRAQAPADAA